MNECFCTSSAVLMVRFGIFRLSYFPLILPPFLGIAGYAVVWFYPDFCERTCTLRCRSIVDCHLKFRIEEKTLLKIK